MTISSISPSPDIQVQRGQTCKLYALSNAMEWLSKTYSDQNQPFQVRKRKADYGLKDDVISLRKRAKELIGSQVGEVYGDKNLIELAKKTGYDNFKSIECHTIAEYCAVMKAAVDKNLMPIGIFDVSVSGYNAGQPIQDNGLHEHAIVVHRYYHNENGELRFVVGQWGNSYDFSARELAESNFQLSEVRQAEEFIKYGNKWYNIDDFNPGVIEMLKNQGCIIRRAPEHNLEEQGTFKRRVIIAAPNGIEYNFNLENVVEAKRPTLEIFKRIKYPFYALPIAAMFAGVFLTMTSVISAPTALLAFGLTTLLSVGVGGVLAKRSTHNIAPPCLDEDPAHPVLEVDFKEIRQLQPEPVCESRMYLQEEEPAAEAILFYPAAEQSRSIPAEIDIPEELAANDKPMRRSQPF